jgi:hypothetical protein
MLDQVPQIVSQDRRRLFKRLHDLGNGLAKIREHPYGLGSLARESHCE